MTWKTLDSNPSPPPAPEFVKPASCPACRATSIVTTAKKPDAESYWRCTGCGEVWNVSRAQADRYGVRRWR